MKFFSDYDRRGVANRLRVLRHRRGVSMAEVAAAAGLSFSQLSKLETGGGKMGMYSLVRLADFYGVRKEWLLKGGEDAEAKEPPRASMPAAKLEDGGDVLIRVCRLACEDESLAKARKVAEALACPLPEALAIVVRQEMKK